MKKQINPTIKAYLIRSAFYFLLLLGVLAIPFALAQRQNSAKQKVAAPPAHSASVPAGNRVDHASGIGHCQGLPTHVAKCIRRQRQPSGDDVHSVV